MGMLILKMREKSEGFIWKSKERIAEFRSKCNNNYWPPWWWWWWWVGEVSFPLLLLLVILSLPGFHLFQERMGSSFWLYFTVDYSMCSWIVCLDWSPALWVSHFFQCVSHWYGKFCIDEQGLLFCLCCRWHYSFYDLGYIEYCSIVWVCVIVLFGEEEMASCSASSFWFPEVTGVTMHCEYRIACTVC